MTHANASLNNMIKQQLRTGDVLDDTILGLYESLPREAFVPEKMREFAYSDMQIPLHHEQRMLTPLEEGSILQALMPKGHETVLEIGTGTGFLTALLSRLCKKVISLDYFPDFTRQAQQKLDQYQCNNVELICGDGSQGWLEQAPYDLVVMTGALSSISETLRLQILPGGKLFAIVGEGPVMRGLVLSLDHEGNWTESLLFQTCVPPLINAIKPREFYF